MPALVESTWVLDATEEDDELVVFDGDLNEDGELVRLDKDDLEEDEDLDDDDLDDDDLDDDEDDDDDLIDLDDEYDDTDDTEKPHPGPGRYEE